jgi:hypothetical protein
MHTKCHAPCPAAQVVMFLRLVTSAEVQRRQDFFGPFIMVRPPPTGAPRRPSAPLL